MLFHFATALIFAVAALCFVALPLWLGRFLRPSAPHPDKSLAYECGEVPVGPAHGRLNPRFAVLALVFLIFEVEVALVVPVAAIYRGRVAAGAGLAAFGALALFVGLLAAGLAYLWKMGDLAYLGFGQEPR